MQCVDRIDALPLGANGGWQHVCCNFHTVTVMCCLWPMMTPADDKERLKTIDDDGSFD